MNMHYEEDCETKKSFTYAEADGHNRIGYN